MDQVSAPVILLAYPHSGVALLQPVLAGHPDLAFTANTGMLPLCESAATVWSKVEGRQAGSLSVLAEKSIRAMASAQISVILAQAGKKRWCELSVAAVKCGEVFLRLYPQAKFLLVHRHYANVIQSAVGSGDLSSRGLRSSLDAHPADPAAGLALFWADHTEALLGFESAHPENCLRVSAERLESDPTDATREMLTFLGLEHDEYLRRPRPAVANWAVTAPGEPGPSGVGKLPAPLRYRVDGLLRKLAYQPLSELPRSPGQLA